MATTIVTKSGSGAPAASDLVAGELAVDLTNKRLYTEDSGGTVLELGTNPSGDVTFADNGKAIFGAGPDLSIYSDGTTGQVTGNVNVTGSVTADGLVVDGASSGSTVATFTANANVDTPLLVFQRTGGAVAGKIAYDDANTAITFGTTTNHEVRFLTNNTEKMQLTADGNLGIGTSSPATALHLSGATGAAPKLTFEEGGAESRIYATKNSPTNSDLRFQTEISGTIADRMVIDYSGSVGIGESSPSTYGKFVVAGSTPFSVIRSSDVTTAGFSMLVNSGANGVGSIATDDGGHMTFDTGATGGGQAERMRIDASGNLLVGKTALDNSTVGIRMNATGDASFVSDGTRPLVLNRKTSDGDIALFLKDGTTVGSIGNIEDLLYIAADDTTDCGIRFDGDNQEISPCTATGAYSDGNIDLGDGSARFKDLYLAGGAYLGGTAAANKLEDYEEGTWTPVLSKATTAPSVTYTTQAGTYTKVGRMIYVSGLLSWTAISGGTGDFHITNLPFTILNSVGAYPQLVCIDYNGVTFGANDTTFGGYGNPNGTYIVLLASKNNATNSTVISGLAGSGFMYFNLTYQAA